MRVLLLTDADVFAGTERHILDLAQGLRQQQVDAVIACPRPAVLADKAQALSLPTITIQKRGLLDRAAIRILRRLLKAGRIDIIHAHNGRTALSAAVAVYLARKGHCVATQHFLEPHHVSQSGPKAVISKIAHGWVNRHVHHLVAISEAVKGAMLERAEAPSSKITVVPNGLSIPDPQQLTAAPQVRAEMGLENATPLVVCVARLEIEKDVTSLVSAMSDVVASCPDAVCVVAGSGSQEAILLDQIEKLNLKSSVKLLGFVPDAISLINAADVFVLPSPAEPFGLVLLEAMALGKPVIATCAGGPKEIVVEGKTGLLVPPANPAALAQAILQLLTNSQSRQDMGREGQARFQQQYTVEQMTQSMLAVYQRVLDGKS